MRLKQLTLQNFGIYKGNHIVDLTVTEDKPIILFGALNGGGKTTFLDALQLVLYGKFAKCSNRGLQSYSKFLTATKNIYASDGEGVKLSLIFSHATETSISEFEIIRTWNTNNAETVDKVQVICNGLNEPHLSQNWDEFVNEFIPLSLSDLFFFDGEKIENLAHPERSSELIRTGIESLLGLDLLTQLQIDLSNVERKRKSENIDSSVVDKVIACEAEIGEQDIVVADIKVDMATLEKKISEYNISINKSRQKIRNSGAHLIEERDSIKFELGAIEEKLRFNLQQKVKLDSGSAPLGLVKALLTETENQIKLEQEIMKAKMISSEINEYEKAVKAVLTKENIASSTIGKINETMLSLSSQRKELAKQERYVGFEPDIFSGLDKNINEAAQQKVKLTIDKDYLLEQKALFDKKLESIPDYKTVEPLIKELAELEAYAKDSKADSKQKQGLLEQAVAKSDLLNLRYTNLLTQQNKDTFEQKRSIQVAEHIVKLKETMSGFADTLVSENIELLEQHIKNKFIALMRKDNLISEVKICPYTFELSLQDTNNEVLEPARLSAGERQLLAIAILWGLAEASGKEIPTVIDTPLGRLDGQHRTKLIDHYFPLASSQVILLSTDEEINGEYYDKLHSHISSEYSINYIEQAKTSVISKGYFNVA